MRRSNALTRHRRPRLESLEPRRVLAADLLISEFMASNDNGLRDEDQQRSDWVEVLNASDAPVSLDGWFLSDDADDLDKWRFPDVTLNARERLIVFASGKNRVAPDGELHTNFRLAAAGDYLALVQPDGITVAHDFGPQFPPQLKDVSFGLAQPREVAAAVQVGAASKILVPTSENGGSDLTLSWTEVDFDDSAWQEATSSIGYERGSTGSYDEIFSTNMDAQMFNINTSAYMRIPFDLNKGNDAFSLTLSMQYDDGYVAYINGQETARKNAPDELSFRAMATDAHRDSLASKFEDVVVDTLQFPGLFRDGRNILAIHALNDAIDSSDFLITPQLTVNLADEVQVDSPRFFLDATPGNPNGLGSTTSVLEATHTPNAPRPGADLTVTATVLTTSEQLPDVNLVYRVMFGDEVTVPMRDDGLSGDGAAGDGVFGATITGGAGAGQMIRYRITAGSSETDASRLPGFTDELNRAQYLGTVVENAAVESNLRVIQLFLEDPAGADTANGTRGALFHDGKFYDNILIDTSGRTIGLAGPKKSHDIFFTSENWFELNVDGQILRMNDFDVINDLFNREKVGIPLAFQTLNELGSPAHLSFPVRFELNGEFYATYSFIDGGNERFLERAGLDPGGALYKMNLGFNRGRGQYKKQTREFEPDTDLFEFFDNLKLEGEALRTYLMDNINIPATVNYLVGLVIVAHGDCCGKNLYLYRDSEGSGEWEPLPWDLDSAFGRGGVNPPAPRRNASAAGLFGHQNDLFTKLFAIPEFKSMYLRRARTLMDQFLQPPGTPEDQRYFENRIDQMVAELAPDVPLDFAKWGSFFTEPDTGRIVFSFENVPTWMEKVDELRNDYFPARRTVLYNQLRQQNGGVELPPQISNPALRFGDVEANPASGNQDEEFIQLTNPTNVDADISGWQLTGGISHSFKPGTVIPAGSTLYVSPNVNAFRARSMGPSGGQGLFVQGNYSGRLSNHGSEIRLVGADGELVDSVTTSAELTATQKHLRVSEVMYNPRVDVDEPRFKGDDYEFIEFVNTSSSESIRLQYVTITDAMQFSFPDMTLGPGERTVVVRDLAGFRQRYGPDIPVAGEYGRSAETFRLSNGGETIRVHIGEGDLVQEFTYDDAWIPATDGAGFSLIAANLNADVSQWNLASGWRSSRAVDGTPGSPETSQGDFNQDGQVDVSDVDAMCSAIREPTNGFDLTDDGLVNNDDLEFLIVQLLQTGFGDSNLDGTFNSSDLVLAFQAGEFEDQIEDNSSWSEGDWNCDGDFTSSDLVRAFQSGRFVAAAEHSSVSVGVASAVVALASSDASGGPRHLTATPKSIGDGMIRDDFDNDWRANTARSRLLQRAVNIELDLPRSQNEMIWRDRLFADAVTEPALLADEVIDDLVTKMVL